MNFHDDNIMKISNKNPNIKEQNLQEIDKNNSEITQNFQQLSNAMKMFMRKERSIFQTNQITLQSTDEFINEMKWRDQIKQPLRRRQSYHIYGEINHEEMEERDSIFAQLEDIQSLKEQNIEMNNEISIFIESIHSLKQLHENVIKSLESIEYEFQNNSQQLNKRNTEIQKRMNQLNDFLVEKGWKYQNEMNEYEMIQIQNKSQEYNSILSNKNEKEQMDFENLFISSDENSEDIRDRMEMLEQEQKEKEMNQLILEQQQIQNELKSRKQMKIEQMMNVYDNSFNVSFEYMKDMISNQILPSMKQIENERIENNSKKKRKSSLSKLIKKSKVEEVKEMKEEKEIKEIKEIKEEKKEKKKNFKKLSKTEEIEEIKQIEEIKVSNNEIKMIEEEKINQIDSNPIEIEINENENKMEIIEQKEDNSIQNNPTNIFNENLNHQIELWTQMKQQSIIFNSDITDYSPNTNDFNSSIMNKSNLIILIETTTDITFGCYLSQPITATGQSIKDYNMFVFTFKDAIPMQFKVSQNSLSDAVVRLYNPSENILLRIGKDLWISKKGQLSSCYQNQRSTFNYSNHENALINVSGHGCFDIKHLQVIEMKE